MGKARLKFKVVCNSPCEDSYYLAQRGEIHGEDHWRTGETLVERSYQKTNSCMVKTNGLQTRSLIDEETGRDTAKKTPPRITINAYIEKEDLCSDDLTSTL